ncbi:MAG: transporter substrate-binding domain-containing protein [Bacillota bacterium]|nr:transporter substrate-binding domain-containing protein [Bacillota bacterium]
MKKILAIILTVILTSFAFAGCNCKSSTKETASNDVVYVIATDTTFAPFEYQDKKGKYVGVDIDLLAAIAKDQGFKYELKPLGFDAACAALESNQADGVIAGMSIKEERKLKYDFSDPYYDSAVIFAVSKDSKLTSFENLKNKVVAVKNGTEGASCAESLKNKYGFTVKYFDESPLMYQEVLTGNAAACVEDFPVMDYGIRKGNGLKQLGEKQIASSYGFAVKKGQNEKLLKMFNDGLKNVIKSGKYQKILDKYFGSKAK